MAQLQNNKAVRGAIVSARKCATLLVHVEHFVPLCSSMFEASSHFTLGTAKTSIANSMTWTPTADHLHLLYFWSLYIWLLYIWLFHIWLLYIWLIQNGR